MNGWLSSPAVLASLVTLPAVSLPVWFYVRVKIAMNNLARHMATQTDLAQSAEVLSERLAALETRLELSAQNRQEQDEWLGEAESLHLNRRGQVLRLHKRGDSVPEIASALRVGQGEVKLIVKIYELSRSTRPDDSLPLAS